MDLSKIEGLTEEQSAAITALHNTETEGLRNKNDQLLGEKKSVQQSAAEQAHSLELARQAAVKAEEEKLVAEGKYKEALDLREKENAELTAKANEEAQKAKDALNNYHKGSALSEVKSLIHDDFKELAGAQLSNMLKVGYNDQQQPVTTFEYEGKVVASSVDEFKGWASEQPQFAKILKGVDSSGAGTTRSHSDSVAGGGEDAAFNQRLKSAGLT
jgi:hypothetical protein